MSQDYRPFTAVIKTAESGLKAKYNLAESPTKPAASPTKSPKSKANKDRFGSIFGGSIYAHEAASTSPKESDADATRSSPPKATLIQGWHAERHPKWGVQTQAAVDTRGGFIEAFFLVYILSMTVIFVNLMSGAPQTLTSKKQLPFACASPVPHQQLISAAFSALIQRCMPARPGVIVSSWEVVAKVKEAERKWHNLSVWQFEQLASHQDMDKSNLVVQFERTKSRGKGEGEGEKDERWKDKTAWSICVVSARRPFLVLALAVLVRFLAVDFLLPCNI